MEGKLKGEDAYNWVEEKHPEKTNSYVEDDVYEKHPEKTNSYGEDGVDEDIKDFIERLDKRFDCKDTDYPFELPYRSPNDDYSVDISMMGVPEDLKQGIPVMFLLRIKPLYRSNCCYHIGFSNNLEKYTQMIDYRYCCDGKIEVLSIKRVKSQKEHIFAECKLIIEGHDIDDDLWAIEKKIYDRLTHTAEYVNPFYKIDNISEKYVDMPISKHDHTRDAINNAMAN